ncbi:MAG TPA: SDR family oxidoreductase [Terracidiphilus sp.]|nr:SDR family oxidoreductase [Terracidiphilus sp.]HEV2463232.1 SDR family oxidoreductase [Acidobacteriaceae bacterium]
MNNILVTGAAGFIGRSIAARYLALGHKVRGVDNFITGKRANLVGLEAMDFIEGDLTNADLCRTACTGIDVVFHEAALASVPRSIENPLETNSACVTATLNLLIAAQATGVPRFVYAGSSSAYGDDPTLPKLEAMRPDPISPYAAAKLAGEYYVRCFARVHGMETVTLRYFNVFGPYQAPDSPYSGVLSIFCRRMIAGEDLVVYGDGEQTRDFTFIDDVVRANELAGGTDAGLIAGKSFNVATGKASSLNDAIRALRNLTGYKGHVHYEPARPGDVRHSQADIELARRIMGFEPRTTFEDGLRSTVEWYRNYATVA